MRTGGSAKKLVLCSFLWSKEIKIEAHDCVNNELNIQFWSTAIVST